MTSQVLISQANPPLVVWARLLRGTAAARRALGVRHGLSISDFEALAQLAQADGQALRRVDLADALQLTPSGVTRLLEGLEAQGLVCKRTCERDGRVTYAVLTDAGRAKLAEASCSHARAVASFFAERYSDAELETLAELLGRLTAE